ncbi:MAG: amino acid ABC transporter substrate-binding protein [Spirochaetaceae bacterium]|nr:MAG: amino acid ABC transporter substrate-binding protein [Spirochaetaceae bacterium]
MIRKVVMMVLAISLVLSVSVFAAGRPEAAPAEDTSALERTPDDPRLFRPGQLTVGTGDPVFPPWMLNDDPASGEGFENAMIYALAEELGFERDQVVWERGLTFDQTIAPGPKPFDFAIRQISVTEERQLIVDFSMVYFQPDKAVIALPTSPVIGAESFDDLRNARWGATIGTTDLDYLENILGIRNVQVFDDQAGTFQAMQGGLIDATVAALPSAIFVTGVQVPDTEIVALLPADPNDRGHGLLFQQDNPLVDWINEGLQAIIERGVVDELIERYLLPEEELPEITG